MTQTSSDVGGATRSSTTIRLTEGFAMLLAGLFVAAFLTIGGMRLLYPYEISWSESAMVSMMLRRLHGAPMYVSPSIFDGSCCLYPPFFVDLSAWVARLLHVDTSRASFLPLRLVSILSCIGLLGATIWVLRGCKRLSWSLALPLAAVFIAAYGRMDFWYDNARVDSLLVLLLFVSTAILIEGRGLWSAALAGVVGGLAVLTKQPALLLLGVVGLTVWLVKRQFLRGIVFAATLTACTVGYLAATGDLWNPLFYFWILKVPGSDPLVWRKFLRGPLFLVAVMPVFTALGLVPLVSRLRACLKRPDRARWGVAGRMQEAAKRRILEVFKRAATQQARGWGRALLGRARRGRFGTLPGFQVQPIRPRPVWRRGGLFRHALRGGASQAAVGGAHPAWVWSLVFGLWTLLLLVLRAKQGASTNFFMPMIPVGAVAAAEGLGWLRGRGHDVRRIGAILALVQLAILAYSPALFLPSAQARREAGELVNVLRKVDGPVWFPAFPSYAAMAGKPWVTHYGTLTDLFLVNPARVTDDLSRLIRERTFGALIVHPGDPMVNRAELAEFYREQSLPAIDDRFLRRVHNVHLDGRIFVRR